MPVWSDEALRVEDWDCAGSVRQCAQEMEGVELVPAGEPVLEDLAELVVRGVAPDHEKSLPPDLACPQHHHHPVLA